MFRAVVSRMSTAVAAAARNDIHRTSWCVTSVRRAHGHHESDEEFDARYEAFFNNPEIDGWDIRRGINDLQGMDLVPEPRIISAALKACRRVNDFALAIRILEAVKDKCGPRQDIWPYVLQEIQPTLNELGVSTPEELGYDKPELAAQDVYDMH